MPRNNTLQTSSLGVKTVKCDGCNGGKPHGHCTCPCDNYCEECGMAKCRAHRDLNWVPGSLNTEYTREFPEKNAPRERPPLRDPYVDSLGKFIGTTTNKADFTPKSANLERPNKNNGLGPALPFSGESTYKRLHDGKMGPRAEAAHKVPENFSGKFYGVTSHQADYTPKDAGMRASCAPERNVLTQPFEGASTYKSDFDKKKISERERRAKEQLLPSKHTDNYTTYGVDYVPLPFYKVKAGDCCADVRHTATRRDPATW